MENAWLYRYSILVLGFTLLLVVAGALVTSNDAALSIPDWPLAWGRLIPPLEGGIRFEFAHRLLAATVSVLILILALWLRTKLGWTVLVTVVAQALLGGAAVRFFDPKALSVAHACLAQLCFGLVVAVVVGGADSRVRSVDTHVDTFRPATETNGRGQSVWGSEIADAPKSVETSLDSADRSVRATSIIAVLSLFVQTALGAAVRHGATSVVPHIVGAIVSTVAVMWAGLQILMKYMENALYRRSASILLGLTFLQVALGLFAYMSRIATADDPQPMPMMITFTVAHVAVGALAFGAAVALALIVYRDTPEKENHGGMAVA
ncbi:MAG TPA: hypothetical protein VKU19_04645 [Bryobacteraceae bacterium]|nr:hypothetical protein [Bryobacteraceae bacterium]